MMLEAMEVIEAPWTPDQVTTLNAFQRLRRLYPFVCANDRYDTNHRDCQAQYGGDFGQLVAQEDGWICRACGYRQFWAYRGMLDRDLLEALQKDQL